MHLCNTDFATLDNHHKSILPSFPHSEFFFYPFSLGTPPHPAPFRTRLLSLPVLGSKNLSPPSLFLFFPCLLEPGLARVFTQTLRFFFVFLLSPFFPLLDEYKDPLLCAYIQVSLIMKALGLGAPSGHLFLPPSVRLQHGLNYFPGWRDTHAAVSPGSVHFVIFLFSRSCPEDHLRVGPRCVPRACVFWFLPLQVEIGPPIVAMTWRIFFSCMHVRTYCCSKSPPTLDPLSSILPLPRQFAIVFPSLLNTTQSDPIYLSPNYQATLPTSLSHPCFLPFIPTPLNANTLLVSPSFSLCVNSPSCTFLSHTTYQFPTYAY